MSMTDMNKLLELSPLALLVAALIVVGLLLKTLKWHPDRLIPITLPVLGAILWPFLASAVPVSWVEKLSAPWVAYALFGLVAGAMAVYGNQLFRQLFTDKGVMDAKVVKTIKPKAS